LALLMVATTAVPAFAAETIWQGDDAKLVITEGEEPYVYAIAQDPANNRWYYETSNHTVKKEVTGGGAIHIFPMVDTTKHSGDWTPDGIYNSGVSNYDVMYCCDATTSTADGIYYKRVNLEDSEYVSDANAKRLRAIVSNAYPYVSVEEAKAALKEAGFAQADELDRSELIAATQAAIWTIANPDSGDSYRYNKTVTTKWKMGWGGYMHEFASEITNFTDSTTSKKSYSNPNGVGDRINALIDFYLAMEGVEAEEGQIVITNLEIKNSKIAGSNDTYNVTLNVELNHGADDNDTVQLNVYVNGALVENKSVAINEATEYSVALEAKANDKIRVEISGTQNLERGVYFYQPKPQDIDGDGIATSREVSQNLIGVACGETPVHAEKTFTVDIVSVDLEVNKVDTEGNSLTGAKFAIYDEEGNLVDEQLVDENGKLVFEGLIPGKYALKELVAPDGYYLPEEAIEVVVCDDGSIIFDGKALVGEMTTTDPVVSENEDVVAPDTTIDLVPGGNTEITNGVVDYENAAKTVVSVRKVTATMTAVQVDVTTLSNGVASVLPALKFDRNDTADQKQQKVDRELYTDNGHFHDPDTFVVTDAPAGYPFKYVGHGDYSGHYVSHIRVIYEKDEAGNAIKDENGNYVIKELQHASSGTPLYYNGELSTNIQGPFHYATGTRAQQFLLKNENGDLIYAYCVDIDTGAQSNTWYAIANLEDNDYYASEEAENHIRNIIENGYWGTESGTG
ncbi:MAG: Cys-Gln thioester bond-forming surface protein, partial [Clostridia bacterium]|nr:Cys-Gln thioester bond-forming surface protein [Clostridia bacterium]